MANILVIGSANMDVVAPLERLPVPGETLLIDDIQLVHGGKGANAAVASARLGADVKFVGCVGEDAFGGSIRQGLLDEGINCDHLTTGDRGSGTAVILLNESDGQNSILVGPGTNYQIVLPDDDAMFEWADSVMLQLETPIAVNYEAALRARSHGVTTILDPAPAVAGLPDELLALVDIVSPNESELATLTGCSLSGDLDEFVGAGRLLLKRGVKELVIKLGSRGALWVTGDSHLHVPSVPVHAVDTTAAGDTFTAALCVGLADGLAMPGAIRRACIAGALVCTRVGAQPSVPTTAEVDAFAAKVTT